MHFINPIEILQLQGIDIKSIGNVTIRKAKRRLLAEIDLSDDGFFHYWGKKFLKSDVEKVINELEEQEKIEFYYFIANNTDLNNFLVYGDIKLFNSFKHENIFELPSFVTFISPFFAEQYDRALFKAFHSEKINAFKKIVTISPLVNLEYFDSSFNSTITVIKERIKIVVAEASGIKNEESIYDENNVRNILDSVKEKLDVNIINHLPLYFQSVINQAASAVRSISVNIFNTFNKAQLAVDIIEYALEFKCEGLVKQSCEEAYSQLTLINRRRLEEVPNASRHEKYTKLLIDLRNKIYEVENKSIPATKVKKWVESTIKPDELNALSSVYDEIRTQIALGLRTLSITVWNDISELDIAVGIIMVANCIEVKGDTKNKIKESYDKLMRLSFSVNIDVDAVLGKKPLRRNVINPTLMFISIIVLIVVIFKIANSGYKSNNINSNLTSSSQDNTIIQVLTDSLKNTKLELQEANNTLFPKSNDSGSTIINAVNKSKQTKFKGNQLKNGISPFDACFGSGIYEQDSEANITFKNGNIYDAVICLVNVSSGITIRNEYICAGSDFNMSNLPAGTYYLKVYFGKDWNPEVTNFCGSTGVFETGAHFSKSDNPKDYIEVTNSKISYTSGTITLYAVAGGNMSSVTTTPTDFFTK